MRIGVDELEAERQSLQDIGLRTSSIRVPPPILEVVEHDLAGERRFGDCACIDCPQRIGSSTFTKRSSSNSA